MDSSLSRVSESEPTTTVDNKNQLAISLNWREASRNCLIESRSMYERISFKISRGTGLLVAYDVGTGLFSGFRADRIL
jgi:hypothetical protein